MFLGNFCIFEDLLGKNLIKIQEVCFEENDLLFKHGSGSKITQKKKMHKIFNGHKPLGAIAVQSNITVD